MAISEKLINKLNMLKIDKIKIETQISDIINNADKKNQHKILKQLNKSLKKLNKEIIETNMELYK